MRILGAGIDERAHDAFALGLLLVFHRRGRNHERYARIHAPAFQDRRSRAQIIKLGTRAGTNIAT